MKDFGRVHLNSIWHLIIPPDEKGVLSATTDGVIIYSSIKSGKQLTSHY